ncbi:MAG: pilus assembly protein CpaF [Candidatus Omnitrophota bacterium]|jgi:pilus assembly protein CpaF
MEKSVSLRKFKQGTRSESGKSPASSTVNQSQHRALHALIFERTLNALDMVGAGIVADESALREVVRQVIRDSLKADGLNTKDSELNLELEFDIIADLTGHGPLQRLMEDPSISDILVNGPDEVWIDRNGVLENTDIQFLDHAHLMRILDRMVAAHGRHLEEATPFADIRLEDGSRLHAIIPPLSTRGPVLSIRKRRATPLQLEDLIASGALNQAMSDFLIEAVQTRKNILVSGGAGAGKTTLLNIIGGFIPSSERVVTIEETLELELSHPHVIPLESRTSSTEGRGEVDLRTLLRNALRMRADRIIVGEVRGSEVFDMLQAMNIGHPGSMSTVHANSPQDALRRLETLLLLSGINLPGTSLRNLLGLSFDVIVQLDRNSKGQRRVNSIMELVVDEDNWFLTPRYAFDGTDWQVSNASPTPGDAG